MAIASCLRLRRLGLFHSRRRERTIKHPLAICSLIAILAGVTLCTAQGQPSLVPNHSVVESYGRMPLSFETNQGQSDVRVKFQARGYNYALFLTESSAVLALKQHDSLSRSDVLAANDTTTASRSRADTPDVVEITLAGISTRAHASGLHRLGGNANYFIGNDPTKWLTGVPTFAKVGYDGVYPGINLVYYGNGQHLEYDFLVAPRANPKAIRLQIKGTTKLKLARDGTLRLFAPSGEIAFNKPFIYQEIRGRRHPVEGGFSVISQDSVGFELGRYNHAEPLVIDPVLAYSTYFGTNLTVAAITVDSSGNTYLTGGTNAAPGQGLLSAGVPVTTGAFQGSPNGKVCSLSGCEGATNAYVMKLDPTGTSVLYATYLGGSLGDDGAAIAVDSLGNAYVTGLAGSVDFPVTVGAFQTVNNAAHGDTTGSDYITTISNAFVTKLNSTGTALIYSSFLGGSGVQFPYTLFWGGVGPAPPYSAAGDYGSSIAVDSSGDAYVTGVANSTDFPVTSTAFQLTNKSPGWRAYNYLLPSNAFVTKLNPSGTALMYSSYLGGSGDSSGLNGDAANSIAVDSIGNAYITGQTYSSNFPVTPSALQVVNNAAALGYNAFVSKVNQNGTALVYSTYLGGSGNHDLGDFGSSIAVDGSGNVYVTGSTYSNDFPVTAEAFQTVNNAAINSGNNGFVSKLDPTGSGLVYSTYLGGNSLGLNRGDYGSGIVVNRAGDAYVTGQAFSTDFPVTPGAFQTQNNAAAIKLPNAFMTALNSAGTALMYSTYLGGSGNGGSDAGDYGVGIAIDASDNAYVTGLTASSNFPVTAGAFQLTPPMYGSDVFVAKLNLSANIPVVAPEATLSQRSVTFASQDEGTSSTAQTVILTNSGTAALTPIGIAVSGDFTETNTCGTDLAAEANCTISVTFTPTAGGVRTGMMTVTDNADGSPQLVTLNGTGEALAVSSDSVSLTISSVGGSASATVSISPQGGFTGTVNLTCNVTYKGGGTSNNPPTCSLSPAQAQVSGNSAVSSVLTVSTTAAAASRLHEFDPKSTELAFASIIVLGLLPRKRLRAGKAVLLLFIVAVCLAGTNGALGCSGNTSTGSGGKSGAGGGSIGTTTGSYQVLITAASDLVTASTTVPLSVQ